MSFIGTVYNRLSELSPFIEVCLRKLYWSNVQLLSKYSVNKNERENRTNFVDFEEVIDCIKSCGIGEGAFLVMHSSYGNLKPTSLDNKGVIERLLQLIGPNGTLAAPVIRTYSEEKRLTAYELFNGGASDLICTYDVKKTPIWSGILSQTLMEHEGSVTSRHPLNPMTAVGRYANEMMKHNIEGLYPSAHGVNSSWKFCADHNAYIIYLGIDFGHHLTMQQVVTESYPEHQPNDFFYKRKFIVKDNDFEKEIEVMERRRNMTVYLPERCVRKDIINSGIMKMENIKGIPICVCSSKQLLDFFMSQRKYYPYYFPFKNH